MSWDFRAPFFDGNSGLVLLVLVWLVQSLFCLDLCLATRQKHLDSFGQIFNDVESVRTLNGLGSAFSRRRGIFSSSITADYRQVWRLSHPFGSGFRQAVRQKVHDAVAFQIHQDCSEPLSTRDPLKSSMRRLDHRAGRDIWQIHDTAQDRRARRLYPQASGESGSSFATGCQPDRRNLLAAPKSHSGPRLDKGGEPLAS
jgi:hypothetical protein